MVHSCFVWNELNAQDMVLAPALYAIIRGWTFEPDVVRIAITRVPGSAGLALVMPQRVS
jgi:hypothetical protein